MMNFKEMLEKRKSCRTFSNKKVDDSVIEFILWAGNRAPFASGGPRREIIAIRDEATKQKMFAACCNQDYVRDCDTILITTGLDLAKVGEVLRSGRHKSVWDCAVALSYMDVAALLHGLGTCWIGHFYNEKVEEIIRELGYQGHPEIILLVGHPEEE